MIKTDTLILDESKIFQMRLVDMNDYKGIEIVYDNNHLKQIKYKDIQSAKEDFQKLLNQIK